MISGLSAADLGVALLWLLVVLALIQQKRRRFFIYKFDQRLAYLYIALNDSLIIQLSCFKIYISLSDENEPVRS